MYDHPMYREPHSQFFLSNEQMPNAVAAIEERLAAAKDVYLARVVQSLHAAQDVEVKLRILFQLGAMRLGFADNGIQAIDFLETKSGFSGEESVRLLILRAIAPFAASESTLVFHGPGNRLWRYFFYEGKLYRQNALIIWPEVSNDQNVMEDDDQPGRWYYG